jgi:diaminohydroxyphosphoribosylaminopyrimidine deaminase / 5-amino-6-(5-phosphoribosylamino)uracil reductase
MKHDHRRDEFFMQRAMFLATLGKGAVSPNPLVGCVITCDDRIIGEGWHKRYGEHHAEVNAINDVGDSSLLRESTVYVNLEPCSHFGKTPPCADLLIQHHVKKVIVANIDSNPLVGGSGIHNLREAGIEVISGILEQQGRQLNKRFFTYIEKRRPYIILKWAETADGFVARENYDSKWISSELSRQLVHKWRTEEDAILVGTRTASQDNPLLNVRLWTGRNPTRVVIDRFLKLNENLHLFDGSQQTLCYNLLRSEEHPAVSLIRVDEDDFITNMLHDMHRRKIQSLFVEGGSTTLRLFIEQNLWDEIIVFKSSRTFGRGIPAPSFNGTLTDQEHIDKDVISYYSPVKK